LSTDVEFPIRGLFQFTDNQGKIYQLQNPQLYRYLLSQYVQLGEGNDVIADLETGELYEPGAQDGAIGELQKEVSMIKRELEMIPSPDISSIEKRLNNIERELEMLASPDLSKVLKRLDVIEVELATQQMPDLSEIDRRLDDLE